MLKSHTKKWTHVVATVEKWGGPVNTNNTKPTLNIPTVNIPAVNIPTVNIPTVNMPTVMLQIDADSSRKLLIVPDTSR